MVLHFRLLPKVLAKAFPYQAVKLELGAINSKKEKWPNSAVRRFKVRITKEDSRYGNISLQKIGDLTSTSVRTLNLRGFKGVKCK